MELRLETTNLMQQVVDKLMAERKPIFVKDEEGKATDQVEGYEEYVAPKVLIVGRAHVLLGSDRALFKSNGDPVELTEEQEAELVENLKALLKE